MVVPQHASRAAPSQCIAAILLCALLTTSARAQDAQPEDDEPNAEPNDDPTYLLHHPRSFFWLSGQLNSIGQYHPPFHAEYSGPYSLRSNAEGAISLVATVFAAARVTATTEVLLDAELAGGDGLSSAVGLGGFTNLDVVRNPTLGSTPYVARAVLHQVIPLSPEWTAVDPGPLRAFERLPIRRLELRAGKFSTADLFDVNAVGSDSHLQFMNWALCNNGAFDYAADTRGYSLGAVLEYQDHDVGVRFGEMLMPTVANGLNYDFDVAHARGENLELEWRHSVLGQRAGVVRLLGFLNHARMGNYRDANDAALAAPGSQPDITASRKRGRTKVGVGINLQQELSPDLRAFMRFGWNDGRNESFAYTEVEDTLELGIDLLGSAWQRPLDKVGLALATNGLHQPHRTYLRLGGEGFLLGDGHLDYGRELIVEAFYTMHVFRGLSPAIDVQWIQNPGFNTDRGPVLVASLRLHAEI